MASDPTLAWRAVMAFSLALVLVMLLRVPLRRLLGARAAYGLWSVPVLVLVAALLPVPAARAALGDIAALSAVAAANARSSALVASSGLPAWWPVAWLAGALAMAGALVWLQRRYRRSLDSAADADGTLRSGRLAGPALVGAWRPALVLPADFESRYPPAEQALVLAHEAEHLRRRDPTANALAAAVLCLFWFHPLAWWAIGRFRFDQELACDESVLSHPARSRRDYAAALLKTQLAADAGWRLPAGCHWAVRHPLKERITMLKRPTPARLQRLSGAAFVLGLGLVASVGAWAGGAPVAEGGAPRTLHRVVAGDRMAPPVYPAEAMAQGITGRVVLQVRVERDGRVGDVRVVSATPAGVFEQAAIDAARQWTFVPGRDDGGQPLAGWVQVPLDFEIHAK